MISKDFIEGNFLFNDFRRKMLFFRREAKKVRRQLQFIGRDP